MWTKTMHGNFKDAIEALSFLMIELNSSQGNPNYEEAKKLRDAVIIFQEKLLKEVA
jgi:hypothetical protein